MSGNVVCIQAKQSILKLGLYALKRYTMGTTGYFAFWNYNWYFNPEIKQKQIHCVVRVSVLARLIPQQLIDTMKSMWEPVLVFIK